jgi:hypothetical protein
MKKLALSLTTAVMLATTLPLAAQAAPKGDEATIQVGGMTDVTSRHRHHWRHHYGFRHRPYYRHYGWHRGHHYGWYRHHRPYFRHYGWYRDW